MKKLVLENKYKIVVPLFGAAFAAPNKGITILSDLDLYHQCLFLQKIEEFMDFSRPLYNFPELFKAYFIYKDFSRKPSKFKYFSSLCEPCQGNNTLSALKEIKSLEFYSLHPG